MAAKLTDLLQLSPQFNDPSLEDNAFVPVDMQAVYMKLAEEFQKQISSLYLDPEELAMELKIGTAEDWESFLNIEPVKMYIIARTRNLATVQARKSIRNLQKSANKGDVQAAKYLNELSGVMQKQADNKTVVLHYVPRPKQHAGGKP